MSGGFFSGAWQNHEFPGAVFNGGSALPPTNTSGYSNGLNAQADARINYNSTLLGDLVPYAYGKPGRLSSQTAFLAIPHMLQKVVPVLSLPVAQWPGDRTTQLFHAVDDGDIAFTINIDRASVKYAECLQLFDKVGALRAIDPFCNLVTVNYLLAGIQLFSDVNECTAWRQFIRDIGMYDDKQQCNRINTPWQVLKLVRDVFIPFGIPRGSDMQGGQTQGLNNPNQFPVDHVTSMLLDGKCQNLINIWRKHNISAGDDMILVLRRMVPGDYVLSRQTNSYNRQRFTDLPHDAKISGGGIENLDKRRNEGVWQLVPVIKDMAHAAEYPTMYDYRENGYWHICRALQMSCSDPHQQYDTYNDATKYRRTGELLEVAFQPLFIEGVPNGSHKTVILRIPGYDTDSELLVPPGGEGHGGGDGLLGFELLKPDYAAPSVQCVGPSVAEWRRFLQAQNRKKKRSSIMNGGDDDDNGDGDGNDGIRNVRARFSGVFNQPISNAALHQAASAAAAVAAAAEAAAAEAAPDNAQEVVGVDSVGDLSGTSSTAPSAASLAAASSLAASATTTAAAAAAAAPTAAALPAASALGRGKGRAKPPGATGGGMVMMGLSGSYLGGGGGGSGGGGTSGGTSGSGSTVRASLLQTPNPNNSSGGGGAGGGGADSP